MDGEGERLTESPVPSIADPPLVGLWAGGLMVMLDCTALDGAGGEQAGRAKVGDGGLSVFAWGRLLWGGRWPQAPPIERCRIGPDGQAWKLGGGGGGVRLWFAGGRWGGIRWTCGTPGGVQCVVVRGAWCVVVWWSASVVWCWLVLLLLWLL